MSRQRAANVKTRIIIKFYCATGSFNQNLHQDFKGSAHKICNQRVLRQLSARCYPALALSEGQLSMSLLRSRAAVRYLRRTSSLHSTMSSPLPFTALHVYTPPSNGHGLRISRVRTPWLLSIRYLASWEMSILFLYQVTLGWQDGGVAADI